MASFSYLVKEELISLEELNKKEFLEGIFQVNAGINLSSTGLSLEYKTKNIHIDDTFMWGDETYYVVDINRVGVNIGGLYGTLKIQARKKPGGIYGY